MELSVFRLLTVALAFVPVHSALCVEPKPKLGTCPTPVGFGICVHSCTTDQDCDRDKKCCSNGCGRVCLDPVRGKPKPKPGSCPPPVGFGICVNSCNTDQDCEINLKCCSNGCGRVCMKPVRVTKPGNCPSPIPHFTVCNDECSEDSHCNRNLKCCYSGCGNQCLSPA